ncbi:DNA primase [Candidatus Saccharibacteria bacterium]|nr:DNA primase [Candidatus Saccharibacteria bacterium]
MQDAKEEVRSRLDIEDIVGEYVQLKRAGRNLKGLSPFTNEKTPSFIVSPDKNIWHDFSSNKGGDIFSFIMEVEGLDFRAALEFLARKAGVDITVFNNRGDQTTAKAKKQAIELNTLANKYYQHSLANNKLAYEYVFNKRKISKEIAREFGVGYAPSSGDALVKFMKSRGIKQEDIKKAGLTNRFGGDMFRKRMTVALMDQMGQIIGFTARTVEDEPNSPKYLNTSQTIIYDKGRHVFGLSQAKESIRKQDFVVIVEGNMDVISSHQAGVTNVVATAGTAMTSMHLKTLSRLTSKIKLAFDNDSAGLAATERAIELAKELDIDLFIVSLPEGAKDPDELIQEDATLWQNATKSETPAVDWVISQYQARENLKTAIGKRNFINAALKLIRLIDDAVVLDYYLTKIGEISEISKTALTDSLKKANQKSSVPKKSQKNVNIQPSTTKKQQDENQFEDNILGLAIINRGLLSLLPDNLSEFMSNEERKQIASFIMKNPNFTDADIEGGLKNIDTYVKIVTLKAEERYLSWSKEEQSHELTQLLHQLKERKRKQKKIALTKQLKDAEFLGDEAKAGEIRVALNKFIKESYGK